MPSAKGSRLIGDVVKVLEVSVVEECEELIRGEAYARLRGIVLTTKPSCQVSCIHAHGLSETNHVDQRRIPSAPFDAAYVGPVESGPACQLFLREASLTPRKPHAAAEDN